MSTVFLFGAGASYGSVDCVPHQPPLGNNLFTELLKSDGFTTTIEGELRCRFEEGRSIARGRQEFVKALPKICFRGASVLQIGRVVSHGRAGAVNGTIELNNGEVSEFCHVFEFTNAKGTSVEQVTSYIIGS